MKTLSIIADDKAAAINGGFLNTTFNQYGQTGGTASGAGSARLFKNEANTGQGLFVGIGKLGVRL